MRYFIMTVLMAALSCLLSPVTPAQPSRAVMVKLDTVRFNVCEPKSFIMPVSIGDVSLQDSLVGVRVIIAWDKKNLDFEDLLVASTSTLGFQFSERMITKDAERGMLFIEMGNMTLRPVAGAGKPLFFLRGGVIAPDTLGEQEGWVQVLSMTFESTTQLEPNLLSTGMVRVVRDTTPGFTGTLSATVAEFDTLRADTVNLAIQNVGNRRVREVSFRVEADTRHYEFADTIEAGTMAGSLNWKVKELTIAPDAIEGRFVTDTDLTTEGTLIKVILRRRNDSAFATNLTVDRFEINEASCLGKLVRQNAQVSAETIPMEDTTSSVSDREWRRIAESVQIIPEPHENAVRIIVGDVKVEEVMIFDMHGRKVQAHTPDRLDASTLWVRFEIPPPSGTYFVALRDRNGIGYKQFTIIK